MDGHVIGERCDHRHRGVGWHHFFAGIGFPWNTFEFRRPFQQIIKTGQRQERKCYLYGQPKNSAPFGHFAGFPFSAIRTGPCGLCAASFGASFNGWIFGWAVKED